MKITKLVDAATLGTGATLPSKTTLVVEDKAIALEICAESTTPFTERRDAVRVCFATSSSDVTLSGTDAQKIQQLRDYFDGSIHSFEAPLYSGRTRASKQIRTMPFGQYLYAWVESPVAVKASVILTELIAVA